MEDCIVVISLHGGQRSMKVDTRPVLYFVCLCGLTRFDIFVVVLLSSRVSIFSLSQESEEEKRKRLLGELSDDTQTQKKKPWYGLF